MERLYQLHHGDVFTVSADLFLTTNWNVDNFKFIKYNFYFKPWWKFWEKRKLKNFQVMYIGDDNIQDDYVIITNEKKCIEEFYKNDQM